MPKFVGGYELKTLHGDENFHKKLSWADIIYDKRSGQAKGDFLFNYCLEIREFFAKKYNDKDSQPQSWSGIAENNDQIIIICDNYQEWANLQSKGYSGKELVKYFCEFIVYSFPNLKGVTFRFHLIDGHTVEIKI